VGGSPKETDPLRRFGFGSARFELRGFAGVWYGNLGLGRDVANFAQFPA